MMTLPIHSTPITKLMQHQLDFIKSNATHTAIVGGFRSGKSHAGVLKTIVKKMQLPGVDVAYYLPSYSLIKNIAFPKIARILEQQNIPYKLHETDKDFITPFGRIIMRSMENYNLIVGYEVGYSLVDEADVLPKSKMQEVLVKVLARNSAKVDGNNNATDFVSTPEGFGFMHDFFITKASPSKKLIRANTRQNPYLPENYIASLKATYTENQLRAYLDGEFVNLTTGNVYYNYDTQRNTTTKTITNPTTLHIGMDFNVTNMNAVVHLADMTAYYAVDEISKAYDTADVIRILKDRYRGHRIIVYPDASGANRNTAGDSDIMQLRQAGFVVQVGRKNPFIRDRVNAMNTAFLNGNNDVKYFVNPHTCPSYHQALQHITYKNGVPDKEGGYDHITDAGGYFVYEYSQRIPIRFYAN